MPLKKSGSKIFLLLAALSEEELEDLRIFLQMQAAKASSALRTLLDYCIGFYPDFEESAVSKEAVHAALFAGQDYKEKRIRDLFSDLSLKVEAYLGWRAFEKEEAYAEALLVREYLQRGLADFARSSGRRNLDRWAEAQTLRADSLIPAFFIQNDFLGLEGEGEWEESVLLGAQERLDQFFVLSKLRLALILFSRRSFLAGSRYIRFWEEIKRQIARESWPEPVKLYLKALELSAGDFSREALLEAIRAYREQDSLLAPEDRKALLQGLVNAILRMINERDADFARELWELYKMGIDNGAMFSGNGELNDTTFTNIVINAANLSEFDWTDRFIGANAGRLPGHIRDNAVALGRAFRSYKQGDFDRVIGILRNVHYSSAPYAVRGRSLLLRTYFDQAAAGGWNFGDEFQYHAEAFMRYVQRNKELSESRKQAYKNFIAFTRKLAQAASPGASAAKRARVREEIEQTQQLIAKEWLLERAAMLPDR